MSKILPKQILKCKVQDQSPPNHSPNRFIPTHLASYPRWISILFSVNMGHIYLSK